MIETVPAEVLARSTWAAGCPVGADDLAYVRLTFWGFDDQRHTGELLLNRVVADDVVGVFRALYEERFPFEELRVTPRVRARRATDRRRQQHRVLRLPADHRVDHDVQPARLRPGDRPQPVPEPLREGDLVLPELASTYLDRDDVRPGMITPDGVVVRAFESIGWTWGGTWSSLKDYQHFSQNGR